MKTQCLPTDYTPVEIDDFVGPARITAQRMANSAAQCLPLGAPAAHLIVGPSGSGKTALAHFALRRFAVNQWNLSEVFGSDLTKEVAQDLAASFRMTNVFGGYRAILVDEFDKSTKEARDRFLGIVGDRVQPKQSLILATSNLSLEEFDAMEKSADARGRLSSRFQVHEVRCPKPDEVLPLAKIWLAEPDANVICEHAGISPNGRKNQPINVRALLKDILTFQQR